MDKDEPSTSKTTLNFRGVNKTMRPGRAASGNTAQYHTTKLEATLRKPWVRLMTAFLYILSVSVSALVLGIYYGVYWYPDLGYMELHRHTESSTHIMPTQPTEGA